MINYQSVFDGVMALLKIDAQNNPLAQKCLDFCESELAFTPPSDTSIPISKKTLLEVYKHSDDEAYAYLKPLFDKSPYTELLVWYFDTEKGSFTVYTDKNKTEVVGIKYSTKTLQHIREAYFRQKEVLSTIGEKPLFDYETSEITFINKKLIV